MSDNSPWYLRPDDPSVVAALDHLRALHRYESRVAIAARVLRRRGDEMWATLLDALETNSILHAHQLARAVVKLEAAADRPASFPRADEQSVARELAGETTAEAMVREIHDGLALYDHVVEHLVAPRAMRGMVIAHRQDHRGFRQQLEARVEASLPQGDAAE